MKHFNGKRWIAAGLAAQFVHYGDEPVHLVVLVLLRVASLLKILLLKY